MNLDEARELIDQKVLYTPGGHDVHGIREGTVVWVGDPTLDPDPNREIVNEAVEGFRPRKDVPVRHDPARMPYVYVVYGDNDKPVSEGWTEQDRYDHAVATEPEYLTAIS